MFLYVEFWRANKAWLSLTTEKRAQYVASLGPQIEALMAQGGIEILGWGENSKETAKRASYDYFGLYRLSGADKVAALEAAIQESGWYDYFDQVNAGGPASAPPDLLRALVTL
ncbi:hypothetical protein JQ616_17485 [Bradyrhizobium tropiciagri]|uniref:DUF6616 family protein n=1 Tax=Bradyrhizobium tropiciagri TaxID=312253 RepID=UPI001BA9A7A7|nr:DUF6616 family protein [Bradyrhizobium tropiciagri]MBR0896759.1 hypothetical protein [Bradyrhizobium tropiciagri]